MGKITQLIYNNGKNYPLWIMRQAGRYLPEYMDIRNKVNNFLDLCYNPELACEITLQPIKRFGFDAAIIFSDILTIPDAFGFEVSFLKNHGPKLIQINSDFEFSSLDINKNIITKLQPVFDAIKLVKEKLPKDKDLIGFSGSPFTLACYMIEGGSSKSFDRTKEFMIKNESFFQELINSLIKAIIIYLEHQIKSGCNIIKLFDSWSGILSESYFNKFVIKANAEIVNYFKLKYSNIPIICFPKGSGTLIEDFALNVNCDILAIDQNFSTKWVVENLQNKHNKIIQGNLDNYLLAFGNFYQIENEVKKIIDNFGKKPFIFNLGHGILPSTPIKNVEFLISLLRK